MNAASLENDEKELRARDRATLARLREAFKGRELPAFVEETLRALEKGAEEE